MPDLPGLLALMVANLPSMRGPSAAARESQSCRPCRKGRGSKVLGSKGTQAGLGLNLKQTHELLGAPDQLLDFACWQTWHKRRRRKVLGAKLQRMKY